MAYTQQDLTNIQAAIASGALEIRFSDRTVTYRSVDDLLKAKNEIQNALNAQSGTKPIRTTRIETGSGWGR